jgi:hypothetical protein
MLIEMKELSESAKKAGAAKAKLKTAVEVLESHHKLHRLIEELKTTTNLNSVYSKIRKAGFVYSANYYDFGLEGKKNNAAKAEFLAEKTPNNVLRRHYYSTMIRSRKTGFKYNLLYAIEIRIIY